MTVEYAVQLTLSGTAFIISIFAWRGARKNQLEFERARKEHEKFLESVRNK